MDEKKAKPITIDTILSPAKDVADAQKEKGRGLGVVFADAFLAVCEDLGYKYLAWGLAEEGRQLVPSGSR